MKEIIKHLESLHITSVLTLNEVECSVAFFFEGVEIGRVDIDNKNSTTHDEDNMLRGLATNYGWKGLYWKLPLRAKQVPVIEEKSA